MNVPSGAGGQQGSGVLARQSCFYCPVLFQMGLKALFNVCLFILSADLLGCFRNLILTPELREGGRMPAVC